MPDAEINRTGNYYFVNTQSEQAGIVYDVRPEDPGAHLYEVTCRVGEPNKDGQLFSLPAWIPGSYMIRDYARHVVHIEASCEGAAVTLRKQDKSTWRAAPVEGPLLIRALIYANDISVRGAYLDQDHAFINGVCLFFRIHGREDDRCIVHLAPPPVANADEWVVATSMARLTGDGDEFGAFVALSYAELIDHPVLMGPLTCFRFDVAGKEHVVALAGARDVDLERLQQDMQLICGNHAQMFGGELPLNRYVFLVTVLNRGYGGLEHRDSTALICAHKDLPRTGVSGVSSNYRAFLGLVSHEYFHLWNVKRIRPKDFVPYRLEEENYTRQLWVFEGITSYYDDLGLLRAGLIGAPGYLDLLGRTLTAVYRSGGRRRQTLEDSSFDAWIKLYQPNENSPNATVSYYRKGAMVALALDLEIRLKSDGRSSLDDVMRMLWKNYGTDSSRGLPDGAFETLAEDVTGVALAEFFRQSLRTTVDPPIGILLAQFGVRLNMRAMEGDTDTGGMAGKREDRPQPWLSFRTVSQDGRVLVRHVQNDKAAAKAGISAHDELVALNGRRITPASWGELSEQIAVNETVTLTVFRRDELREFSLVATLPPRDTCYLTIEDDVDAATAARRMAWLGV